MAQSWALRLGSALAIAGSALLLLAVLVTFGVFIPKLFFTVYQNQGFLTASTQFVFAAPFASGLCFLSGLVGLLLVQQNRWGRLTCSVAVLGQALFVVTHGLFIWPLTWGLTWWGSAGLDWYDRLSLLSGALIALGLVDCGIFTLRSRALPRWNAVPLLLGLWLGFSSVRALLGPQGFFIVYTSFAPPTPPQDLWVFVLMDTLSLLLWGSLGVGLWLRKNLAPPQVQPAII